MTLPEILDYFSEFTDPQRFKYVATITLISAGAIGFLLGRTIKGIAQE